MPTQRHSMSTLLVAALIAVGLAPLSRAQQGTVGSFQKITEGSGGFFGPLSDLDEYAYSMCSLGDLDGDGHTDIAVGAPWDDDGGTDRGAVWIHFLNADGTVKATQKISDTQGNFTGVIQDEEWFGWSVSAVGDVNHDGITDLAVGSIQTDDGSVDAGAVWLLFMNTTGTVKTTHKISFSSGGFGVFLFDFSWFGSSVCPLGDIDGDGVVDLAVGSHGDSDSGTFVGAVYALHLKTDGTVKSSLKINEVSGGFTGALDDGDEFGWAMAPLGDLDGNGTADLAVTAELDDDGGQDRGAVWVLYLQPGATIVKSSAKISATEGDFTGVLDNKDHFGRSIAALGDFDGDGVGDLCVGAYQDDDGGSNKGAAWNLFLNADGTVASYQKISATEGGFSGALDLEDKFGGSVAGLGDLNGDGVRDVAVGASLDDDTGTDTGALWVLFLNGGTWTNLGFALEGTKGLPSFTGSGTLAPLTTVLLNLSNARPNSAAVMFVSTSSNPTPFKGGMVVPVPTLALIGLTTSPIGEIPLNFTWPSGIPSGTSVVLQYAIQDPLAIKGVALSNGLKGTTP